MVIANAGDWALFQGPGSDWTTLQSGSLSLAKFDAILMPTLAPATTIRIQCNHTTKWLERLVSQTICRKTSRFAVVDN
jgi:hypothetical protein